MSRENLQHALNVCALVDYETQRLQDEREQEEEGAADADEERAGRQSEANTSRCDSSCSAILDAPQSANAGGGRGEAEGLGSSLLGTVILAFAKENPVAAAAAAIVAPLAVQGFRKITRRS